MYCIILIDDDCCLLLICCVLLFCYCLWFMFYLEKKMLLSCLNIKKGVILFVNLMVLCFSYILFFIN